MTVRSTIILLSYNNGRTLGDALAAVCAQDVNDCEVIVADDCSTDDSWDVATTFAAELGAGDRLRIVRNARNLGILGNLAAAARLARSEFIILAAGDDLSHPGRARALHATWLAHGAPKHAVVYSGVLPIDASGVLVPEWDEAVSRPPWSLRRLADGKNGPLGASCAITRSLITSPSPIAADVRHEDRVFPFRALLMGGAVLYVDEPMVDYRISGGASRFEAADRFTILTEQTAHLVRRTLPDAYQRLRDAIAVCTDQAIIARCRQFVIEQEALLRLAEGGPLFGTTVSGVCKGGRVDAMTAHLLRHLRARVERYLAS